MLCLTGHAPFYTFVRSGQLKPSTQLWDNKNIQVGEVVLLEKARFQSPLVKLNQIRGACSLKGYL